MTDKTRIPNLTPEHIAQINIAGLYKANPDDFRSFWQSGSRYWDVTSKYHCRNWCFEPHVWSDGRLFMTDNYWGSSSKSMSYEITDDNFDEMWPKFTLVMDDRNAYKKIDPDRACLYEPEDVVYDVAAGSGGYTCSSTTWVRKDVSPTIARRIADEKRKLSREISSAFSTSSISWTLSHIEDLVKQASDEGIDIVDTADREDAKAAAARHCADAVELGSVADGDMAIYLAERCYCPGEVYDVSGYYYDIFSAKDKVLLIGEPKKTGEGRRVEAYLSPDAEQVVEIIIDGDGHVADAVRFDATANNISECTSSKMPREYDLDSWKFTHVNIDVAAVIERAHAVKDAIDALKEALGC